MDRINEVKNDLKNTISNIDYNAINVSLSEGQIERIAETASKNKAVYTSTIHLIDSPNRGEACDLHNNIVLTKLISLALKYR